MKDLIEAVLDRGPIYRYADPFGALNLAVMGEGEQLQWHFDQTDFVVSLAIQSAEVGGDFEVAPRIRQADDEHYDDVAAVLGGDRSAVETLAMTPGTLLDLRGPVLLAPGQPDRRRADWRHVGLLGLRHQARDHGERPAAGRPLRAHRTFRRAARHLATAAVSAGSA